MSKALTSPLEYVASKIRRPVWLDGQSAEPIGLNNILGTHGTSIETIIALARTGVFPNDRQDPDLQGTFHLTPNLRNKLWKKTDFSSDVELAISKIGYPHPIEISTDFATSATESKNSSGVVVTFGKQILGLIREVDIDEMNEEPEIVLSEAPPLEAVKGIYPVDVFSAVALASQIDKLR